MADIYFDLNGEKVLAKPFNTNTVCEFSERGLEVGDIVTKAIPTMRAYIGICLGVTDEEAGNKLDEHMNNGGSYSAINDVMNTQIENSGFMKGLIEEFIKSIQAQTEEIKEQKKVQPQDHKKSQK